MKLCVAGSSAVYQTPEATINVRGRKLVIQTSDNVTKVSMLEGESTVRTGTEGNIDLGGQILKAGQQAIIQSRPRGEPPVMKIIPIPPGEMTLLDDKVSMACMAKKTVYFEVVDRKTGSGPAEADKSSGEPAAVTAFDSDEKTGASQEIVPVQVAPADLPVQYTVSPARLLPK